MLKKGFTLIELLVVIAIIGLLSTIVIASLTSSKAKGRDAKRVSDVRSIQLALESFYNDYGYYPPNIYSGTPNIAPTYIPAVPKDPRDNTTQYPYVTANSIPSSNCVAANKPIKYHVAAYMESDKNSNPSLMQDADAAAFGTVCATVTDFDGNANNCSGVTAAPLGADNCYDQIN